MLVPAIRTDRVDEELPVPALHPEGLSRERIDGWGFQDVRIDGCDRRRPGAGSEALTFGRQQDRRRPQLALIPEVAESGGLHRWHHQEGEYRRVEPRTTLLELNEFRIPCFPERGLLVNRPSGDRHSLVHPFESNGSLMVKPEFGHSGESPNLTASDRCAAFAQG